MSASNVLIVAGFRLGLLSSGPLSSSVSSSEGGRSGIGDGIGAARRLALELGEETLDLLVEALHEGDDEGHAARDDREHREEDGGAAGLETELLGHGVAKGHERDHLEPSHEGAELDPAEGEDRQDARETAGERAVLRGHRPEAQEDGHRDAQQEEVGDQEEVEDADAQASGLILPGLRRQDDRRDVRRQHEELPDAGRHNRAVVLRGDVLGHDGDEAVLEGVHRGGHHADREGEAEAEDEARLRGKQVEEREEAVRDGGGSAAQVLCLGEHAEEAEEDHGREDERAPEEEAVAQLLVVHRGVDALPAPHVEEPGANDREDQRPRGLEAGVVPRGDRRPGLRLDAQVRDAGEEDDDDEDRHDHALRAVRPDGRGEARGHGVQHRDQGHRDDSGQRVKPGEGSGQGAHGRELRHQIDPHVEHADDCNVELRRTAEALLHPVREAEAVGVLLAHLGAQVEQDQVGHGRGDRVAEDAVPVEVVASLRRREDHPGAHPRGEEAEAEREPPLGAARAVPEVGALRALVLHTLVDEERRGHRHTREDSKRTQQDSVRLPLGDHARSRHPENLLFNLSEDVPFLPQELPCSSSSGLISANRWHPHGKVVEIA
mmetsp:Transcript_71111/g.153283  ORF Transcript_71111/g.153283 Transcript_71111/m.153283 type:complete len:605 (-) Transcript_71111:22-1836(-)